MKSRQMPSTWEDAHSQKKDYEFGLMLKGCRGIADVQKLTGEGNIVLEHLMPVDSEKPMDLRMFMELAVDMTEAVATMHEKNIIHNSINPQYVHSSLKLLRNS